MALIRPSTLSLWGREGDVRQQEKKQAGGAVRAGQRARQGQRQNRGLGATVL